MTSGPKNKSQMSRKKVTKLLKPEVMKVVKNRKQLRANGHINIPNVGSNSECIGLTYTIRGLKSISQLEKLGKGLDKKHDGESSLGLVINNLNGGEFEEIIGKYKIRACDSDEDARGIKDKCDKYLKKQGGQTTLDAPDEEDDD